MKVFLLIVLSYYLALNASAEKVRFDDYRLYHIYVDNEDNLQKIHTLRQRECNEMKFWKDASHVGQRSDIMVSPKKLAEFQEFLETNNLRNSLSIENIQKLIDESSKSTKGYGLEWTEYHTLDEIYDWLDKIIEEYPEQVSPFNIGKSYEGRDIRGVKISYKNGNPAFFIESNMHAREWITSATITWFINELLTSNKREVIDLATNIDWYIIPVLNPDGFVFTHTTNRMWRKTRQPHSPDCIGADLNRNFDYLWMAAGASSNPCSETYAGPKPNSEPEVQALIDFFKTIPQKINIYLSMHSYGQLVLSPYGHTNQEFPYNYEHMLRVAAGFASAVSPKFGSDYKFGASSVVLYEVSGSSKEWAFGDRGIPISYTIELRDKGKHGFVLPPEQIIPTAKEVLDGFVGMVRSARLLKYL